MLKKILSEEELSPDNLKYVRNLLEDVGNEVEGDAFRVTLESTNEEHVVVLTKNSIVSSELIINATKRLLSGLGTFKQKRLSITAVNEVVPYAGPITPKLTVTDLFDNDHDSLSTKICTSLGRGGIRMLKLSWKC